MCLKFFEISSVEYLMVHVHLKLNGFVNLNNIVSINFLKILLPLHHIAVNYSVTPYFF